MVLWYVCVCILASPDGNPDDIETIRSVAMSVASSMSKVGVPYTTHRMVDIYSASGTIMDWYVDHESCVCVDVTSLSLSLSLYLSLSRLLDLKASGEVCSSLVPITLELRPTLREVNSTTEGFMLPQSQVWRQTVDFHRRTKGLSYMLWDITL